MVDHRPLQRAVRFAVHGNEHSAQARAYSVEAVAHTIEREGDARLRYAGRRLRSGAHDERPMSDATEKFFDELARRGHEPALSSVAGRVRFDIVDAEHTDHWLVHIDHGAITVSRQKRKADCTVRADVDVFDRLARGEDNAMAATLRGALVCS